MHCGLDPQQEFGCISPFPGPSAFDGAAGCCVADLRLPSRWMMNMSLWRRALLNEDPSLSFWHIGASPRIGLGDAAVKLRETWNFFCLSVLTHINKDAKLVRTGKIYSYLNFYVSWLHNDNLANMSLRAWAHLAVCESVCVQGASFSRESCEQERNDKFIT